MKGFALIAVFVALVIGAFVLMLDDDAPTDEVGATDETAQ